MRLVRVSLFACSFAVLVHAQNNDGVLHLDESAVRQQLLQSDAPVYPAIAQAARIQGDVSISVVIGGNGLIASETVRSGPPMLRQAALDAVRKWKFTPFKVDGKAIRVASILTVPFSLAKLPIEPNADQQKAAQAAFPLSDKCRGALKANNLQDALSYCAQLVNVSYKAGDLTSSDQLMLMDAHELYGHALLAAGRSFEALNEENKAIAEAKICLTEKDQEYAMPFYWRAMVEVATGETDQALSDFTVAEQTQRRALANLPEMKHIYGRDLASILRQHAALLEQIGRSADASSLRAEAAAF